MAVGVAQVLTETAAYYDSTHKKLDHTWTLRWTGAGRPSGRARAPPVGPGAPRAPSRSREEDEEVRGELYSSLSKMDDEAAHRAMARGFKVEPPGVLQRLSQVLWRQKGAVEVLVREHLAAAWSNDRGFANRIVKLLKDEYVEVQPSWIPHAPEELRRAPGPVLARE